MAQPQVELVYEVTVTCDASVVYDLTIQDKILSMLGPTPSGGLDLICAQIKAVERKTKDWEIDGQIRFQQRERISPKTGF